MVSKTGDIPATVPASHPAEDANGQNGNQDGTEILKATLKDPCACGKVNSENHSQQLSLTFYYLDDKKRHGGSIL